MPRAAVDALPAGNALALLASQIGAAGRASAQTVAAGSREVGPDASAAVRVGAPCQDAKRDQEMKGTAVMTGRDGAAGARLELGWLDRSSRRRLTAALVAHRAQVGPAVAELHAAFVDAVIAACDLDDAHVMLPAWPVLDDRRPALDGTLAALESTAVDADWSGHDDGAPVLLRCLREAVINATGWIPKAGPRQPGRPAAAVR